MPEESRGQLPPEIKEGEWIQRREHEPVSDLEERERRMLEQGRLCREEQNRLNALAVASIKDADKRSQAILDRMNIPKHWRDPLGRMR